jgi:hypothetical protein
VRVHALFGPRADAALFLGPLAFAAAVVALARAVGAEREVGLLGWLVLVVGIDVAHVWSTLWVTLLRGDQRAAHGGAFARLALAVYVVGVVAHALFGSFGFWRLVAYAACFHFVRQQVGWVHLARAKAGEHDALGARLDAAVVALAALEPLAYWHVHGRSYGWMIAGDFVRLPAEVLTAVRVAFAASASIFLVREVRSLARGDAHLGKILVVASTALGWHAGIERAASDLVFTAFNTAAHAAPYVYLVSTRAEASSLAARARSGAGAALAFLVVLAALACGEEALWESLVWGDHGFPAPPPWAVALAAGLVPLLALPQLVHYAADAVIWRRAHRPSLREAPTSP